MASELRLPKTLSAAQKEAVVQRLLDTLGLAKVGLMQTTSSQVQKGHSYVGVHGWHS